MNKLTQCSTIQRQMRQTDNHRRGWNSFMDAQAQYAMMDAANNCYDDDNICNSVLQLHGENDNIHKLCAILP